MTRIMQLSDIGDGFDEGWLTPSVCTRIGNHLYDYCNSMSNSSSDRYVSGLGWTTNGYIRVEYKVMDSTRVAVGRYTLFYLGDGTFYRGPEMGHVEDLHPIGPPPPPPPPSKPRKDAWYLHTGKADLDYERG